jgi:predicted dehydrogenase
MTKANKLRIGLFGLGHLGKIHLSCLRDTPFDIVGVYDPKLSEKMIQDHPDIKCFKSEEDLLKVVDAVDVVTTTSMHFSLVEKAIAAGKHVFVEKPITSSLGEAEVLKKSIEESGLIGQVGHVERYNPAFLAAKDILRAPKFIEAHRLAPLNPRGNDVSVILDLMIHDLDLVLDLVDSKIVGVAANGVSVINSSTDIGNARITFENGCVANVTASRISMKHMRKIRLFQEDAYVSIDFLEKDCQIIYLSPVDDNDSKSEDLIIDTYKGKQKIKFRTPDIQPNNAITQELTEFYSSILSGKQPKVSFAAGYESVKLARIIEQEIEKNLRKVV